MKEVIKMANDNKSAVVTVTPLTADALIKSGLVSKVDAKAAKAAKAAIRADGGYFPDNGSDALAVISGNVLNNAKAAAKAGRAVALSLAMIDESGEYKRLNNPYGKPFKTSSELFRALFPSLADTTLYNYLNVGKEIYLPASRGALPENLKVLDTLEPGTALSAVGALRDESVRKCLPKAIGDVVAEKGKLSQAGLKAAVKAAKEAAKAPVKSDGTAGTPAKDAKAKHETDVAEMRAALVKVLRPDKGKDEIVMTIDNDEKADWKALLDNAIKTPESAVLFVEALKALTV